MDITYLGGNTVKLSGKNLHVVCDPAKSTAASKSLAKANVVSYSTDGLTHPNVVDDAMVLDLPGEYEVGGAMITGVAGGETTMFSFNIDGVNVVVTGPVDGELSADRLEALGKVDALVLRVGDHAAAAALVAKLEPAYVVPVGEAKPEAFLKEMGVNPEPAAKLKLSPKDLPTETQVVVLTAAS
jgi:L-ascorbate metabolism protein UlaG (beta-lactamase superfamily)